MEKWGDYHFARAICKHLERLGERTSLRIHDEWELPVEDETEVVLTLRGKFPAAPALGRVNIMWIISHPGDVCAAECEGYDVVAAASEQFAQRLARDVSCRVIPLLQCTDPEVFHRVDVEKRYDILFVGNSRDVPRPGPLWAKDQDRFKFRVWGRHWSRWLKRDVVEGLYWPNERLSELYGATHVLLNDHYEDMKAHGFISNRIFDGLACKCSILTDSHPGLRELFPDEVLYYEDQDSLLAAVDTYFREEAEIRARVERGYQKVLAAHTFEHRAARLIEEAKAAMARRSRATTSAAPSTAAQAGTTGGPWPGRTPRITVMSWDVCRNHFSKAYSVAEVLSRRYDVQLVGFRFFGDIFAPFRDESPPFETVCLEAARFPDFYRQMQEAVSRVRGDVIYGVKPKLASLGVALLHQLAHGTPIALEINDLESAVVRPGAAGGHSSDTLSLADVVGDEARRKDMLDPVNGLWDRLFDGFASEAQQIVTHNENLNRRYGGRAVFLRNIKDERFYSPELYDRQSVRREFGIAPDEKVVLFGGLVRRHKGVFETVEVLRRLGDPDFRLLVVGARPDAPDQRKLLSEHGDVIRIVPPQNRNAMAKVNLAADLVILWLDPEIPASHYQMPYKLTDALAMEVPVIASPVSDLEALGKMGVLRLAPFGDYDAMVAAIQDIFANREATGEMVKRGRQLYLKEFSYAAAEQVLFPLVEQLAEHKVEPSPRVAQLADFLASMSEASGTQAAAPEPAAPEARPGTTPAPPTAATPIASPAEPSPAQREPARASRTVREAIRRFEERHRQGVRQVAELFCSQLTLAQRYRLLPQDQLVSVIMPTYNRAHCIGHAIESVLGQRYENWELIIADDGSSDDTPEVVRKYTEADPRVKGLRLAKNAGAASARNLALAQSRGSLIAYLDTDNVWMDLYLLIMVGMLKDHPERSTAYTGYFDVRLDQDRAVIMLRPFDREALLRRNYIDLNTFMHRRQLYERLGGFDERLVRQQDWDLALKYTEHETPLVVPAVLCYYYRKRGWGQLSEIGQRAGTREIIMAKWRREKERSASG